MQVFIIGDGLTKDQLGSEAPFTAARGHVGRAEVERLLGQGKAYGKGPLPTFLQLAAEQAQGEGSLRLIALQTSAPPDSGDDNQPVAWSEVLAPSLAQATILVSPADALPWQGLSEIIQAASEMVEAEGPALRFVILGCHTERRILMLASFLRNVGGNVEVAVSPHLLGSASPEAHFGALRHHFPGAGVKVMLDLEEITTFAGMPPSRVSALACRPPQIGPAEVGAALDGPRQRVLELLCMNWTRAELRPLAGGFSGSLLLLANGWKGQAKTEPLVLKVDGFAQMRRELDGYYQVKDLFGKHVPTFGYPVEVGDFIGVGMELAAMEGSPRTLQETFEDSDSDESLARFMLRLEKTLTLVSDKLYRNTAEATWVVPYRAFGLHAEKQARWLLQNAEIILSYVEEDLPPDVRVDPRQLAKLLRLVAANPDGIDSEVCLVHGDLNCANIICDEGDNVWFIDWTHCSRSPIELDFAKLESDTKFVMSKDFDADDFSRLRMLEEYFLEQRIPGDVNALPERMKFAKWDLRFRKIVEAVRRIRLACFALKASEDWLVYRIALLRYATHNLSFDKQRGRGECSPAQLLHALFSVEALIFNLVADDFNLKIRAERPAVYPPRQRLSIDEAPWIFDSEGYDPSYYVDPSVLQQDRSQVPSGWADPEDFALVRDLPRVMDSRYKDEDGRPLNPHGRTGLAGRGLLGLWGANMSVAALVIRRNPDAGHLEILLGKADQRVDLELPKTFVLPDELAEDAIRRVLAQEAGWAWKPGALGGDLLSDGFAYDARQTDHAWVTSRAYLLLPEHAPTHLTAGGDFDTVKWWPLKAETVNQVPSDQARFIREGVLALVEQGRYERAEADALIAATG